MTLINKLLQIDEPFTASSQDIRILQANAIKRFLFTVKGTQSGVSTFTISDILSILANIQLKIGGDVISELSALEFYIYNLLKSGDLPDVVLPAAVNDIAIINNVPVPLYHTPSTEELSMRLGYAALVNMTDVSLSIAIEETKEAMPEKEIYFQKYTFVPPSTGAYNILLDSTFGADIIGFLIKSTTIPSTAADVTSCKKLRLRLGTEYVYENLWNFMTADKNYNIAAELKALITNYALLDFSETPIVKGTEVQISVESEDLNAVEVIVISQA